MGTEGGAEGGEEEGVGLDLPCSFGVGESFVVFAVTAEGVG